MENLRLLLRVPLQLPPLQDGLLAGAEARAVPRFPARGAYLGRGAELLQFLLGLGL